jgi:SAM-dependent methyltransferase
MLGHDEIRDRLRSSYDAFADEREGLRKQVWKLTERADFAQRMRDANATRLLELGAGTGQDSAHFQELGFEVVATDLSPAMVDYCRGKGIDARVMDMLHLGFAPGEFDAVYAMNSLLHVPNVELAQVLAGIRTVLRPAGLCYVGLWGGSEFEGIAGWDHQQPQRFFSFRTDEQLRRFAEAEFEIVDFHPVKDGDLTFQSLTLRAPA